MSMYQIISVKTPPVVAHDAPRRRVMPQVADLEATLAAMKADAAKWKKRKAKEWGEEMAVNEDETLCRKPRSHWTVEQLETLEADVIRVLSRNGPMSKHYMETLIRVPCNRHKLRDVLRKMKAEGAVDFKQVGSTEKHWSLA